MNILLINHYAGSPEYGMEYRPYYLSREWVKMGHNVTIVGANFSHLRIKQPQVGEEFIDGIRYVWLDTPMYQGNGMGRIKNMLTFLWKLYRQQKRITGEHNPDVVIASSTYPLDIYPAHYIAKKYKAKLVFEVHDIWPLSPMEIGHMSKYHPFIMVMQMAENYMCRHVDKLISLAPKAEEHYLEHGLAKGKFVHIPNGVIVDKNSHGGGKLPADYIELFTKLRSKEKFILGYAGGMAKSNALTALVEAVSMVQNLPMEMVLVGKGTEKMHLLSLVKKYGLKQVHFLPPVSKGLVPELLAQMDALYIGWQETKLYQYGVSANKIFDYMLAEKPILWAGNTGNNPVMEARAGIAVSGQPADIAGAIRKMVAEDSRHLAQWGRNGSVYVKDKHNYRNLAEKFIHAIS